MQTATGRRRFLVGLSANGAAGLAGLLGLQETGLCKVSPQQVIADGTDWRFLDELKRKMKN